MNIKTASKLVKSFRGNASGKWQDRIVSQLEYALELSRLNKGKYDKEIIDAVKYLDGAVRKEGVITKCLEQRIRDTCPLSTVFWN